MDTKFLPKGSLVLVTGVTGYIGGWVANELIASGYRVRGALRNQDKGKVLQTFFEEKFGKGTFEISLVPDYTIPGAHHNALHGVSGIIHLAADFPTSPDPKDIVNPAIAAIKSILADAAAEETVKRFVLTSSSVAAASPTMSKVFTFNSESWNDFAIKQAYEKPENHRSDQAYIIHAASKALTERAAWTFMKNTKPGFVLNTVLPNFAMGPILFDGMGGNTRDRFRGFFYNDESDVKFMQWLGSQYWINVLDIARIHVAALIEEDVKGERLYAFGNKYTYNGLVDAVVEYDPKRKAEDVPPKIEDPGPDLSSVDDARSVELLRRLGQEGWTGWAETLRASVE